MEQDVLNEFNSIKKANPEFPSDSIVGLMLIQRLDVLNRNVSQLRAMVELLRARL